MIDSRNISESQCLMNGDGPYKKLFKFMNPKAGNVKKNNRYYHIYLYNKCLSTMYSKRRISFSVRGISIIIGELMLQVHCTRRTAIAGKKSGLASAAFFILKEMFRCGSWENKKTMTLCLLIIVLFRWKEVIVSKKHLLKQKEVCQTQTSR